MQLKELQESLANAVYNNDSEITREISDKKITPDDRLQIYRNNVFTTLQENLTNKYEAVCKLVGEEFFKYAAYEYIKENKPTSGNLDDYGQSFSDFLNNFSPVKEFAYLPDIAKLEWLYHIAYFASDASLIDKQALAKITPEKMASLHFTLHPSAQLISSQFPIDKIWQFAKGFSNTEPNINERGVDVLIVRPDLKIEVILLEKGELQFLDNLKQGQNLYQSFEEAVKENSNFDFGTVIAKFVKNGVFTGMR